MKITREWIHRQATIGKGFTRNKLAVLGVKWPPKKGWLSKLVGKEISEETRLAFESGGFVTPTTVDVPPLRVERSPKLSPRVKYKTQKPQRSAVATNEFLQTPEWRRLRMLVIKKRGTRCECCGASPQDGVTVINIDHIKPRRDFPELALAESNLQVLCAVCNHGKGNWDQTDWRQPEPEPEPLPDDWCAPMWWKPDTMN